MDRDCGDGDPMAEVLSLEDQPRTIEDEKQIVTSYGLKYYNFARPRALGAYLEKDVRDPNAIGAIILDMHIRRVSNLKELNLPDVDTGGGEAVGLAVVERYLRRAESPYKLTPVAILTGFDLDAKIQKRIDALLARDKNSTFIRKEKELKKFEEFIKAVRSKADTGSMTIEKKDGEQDAADYLEGLDIAEKIATDLKLDWTERGALFGYLVHTEGEWRALVATMKGSRSQDIYDRIDMLIEIKSKLDGILDSDLNRERQWLSTKQQVLDEKSPLELLKSRHLHELAHILGILKRVTG